MNIDETHLHDTAMLSRIRYEVLLSMWTDTEDGPRRESLNFQLQMEKEISDRLLRHLNVLSKTGEYASMRKLEHGI